MTSQNVYRSGMVTSRDVHGVIVTTDIIVTGGGNSLESEIRSVCISSRSFCHGRSSAFTSDECELFLHPFETNR